MWFQRLRGGSPRALPQAGQIGSSVRVGVIAEGKRDRCRSGVSAGLPPPPGAAALLRGRARVRDLCGRPGRRSLCRAGGGVADVLWRVPRRDHNNENRVSPGDSARANTQPRDDCWAHDRLGRPSSASLPRPGHREAVRVALPSGTVADQLGDLRARIAMTEPRQQGRCVRPMS